MPGPGGFAHPWPCRPRLPSPVTAGRFGEAVCRYAVSALPDTRGHCRVSTGTRLTDSRGISSGERWWGIRWRERWKSRARPGARPNARRDSVAGIASCTVGLYSCAPECVLRGVGGGRLGRVLVALAGAVHQLLDARLEAAGAVGQEGQVRYVTDAHALLQLIADIAFSGFKAGDGIFFGLFDVLDRGVPGDGYTRADLPPGFSATSSA